MDDLLAAKQLLTVDGLTNLVAFHAQQCIEKSMKALIEEISLPNVKTHDLLRLYRLLHPARMMLTLHPQRWTDL